MRRNSNYFGDVSQFFLKAKRKENIELDPEIKNRIRSSLELKIQDLKYQPDQTVIQPIEEAMPIDNLKPIENFEPELEKPSFWQTWRYQFIGVPASLFALLVIVFAANNFKFALPSPSSSQDFTASILEDVQVEDKPIIAETKPRVIKEPEQQIKTELLVLNINDLGSRSLNEIPTTTTIKTPVNQTQTIKTDPVVTQESVTNTADLSSGTNQSTTPQTTTTATQKPEQLLPEPELQLNTNSSLQQEPVKQDTVVEQTENTATQIADQTVTTTSATPATTQTTTTPTTETTVNNSDILNAPLSSKDTTDTILANKNVLIRSVKEENYSVSYYTTSSFKTEPAFDKSIVNELISGKSPSAVNVFYTDATHVTVEIKEGTVTKYYSYEQKGLEWTVNKFWSTK